MSPKRIALLVVCLALLVLVACFFAKKPSSDRDWVVDQSVLPTAEFSGDSVLIRNVRNFTYASDTEFTPAYDVRTYDLGKLSRTWYAVVPFGAPGVAHAFLTFEFEDGEYLSVSVEARKEKGEVFSPIRGAFRAYELMYVIGDERDVVGVRANHRKHEVYLYPLTLSREQSRAVLTSMLADANALALKPAFYNTFTGSCMTGVAKHLAAAGARIPLSMDFLLPAYSDKLFYELGLIDTDLPFAEAKHFFHVNDRAEKFAESDAFSAGIRSH